MKNSYLSLFLLSLFYASPVLSQQVTATLSPYNIPFATGYVDDSARQFSGQIVDIASGPCFGFNSGFIMFDASPLPAGAVISAATIELAINGSCTSGDETAFGFITGIATNTIYGKTSKKEIASGPVYADKLEWGNTSIIGPLTNPLTDAGVAALQKKIGAAFCVGIHPPSSTNNSRTFGGYNSNAVNAPPPVLRVTYTPGNPSKPNADFTMNVRDTFINAEVSFYDNSGNYPTSWFWEFGDDSTSTLQNPIHAYADTGYYTIKLTAKNAQGEDVMTKQNVIHISPIPPPPIAEFAVDLRNLAEGEEASFADLSIGVVTEWKWRFGDNESSSEQNPNHTYFEKGVYTVRLIVSSPFGSDTMLKEDFMNVGGEILEPIADFSFDNSKGLTIHFQDLCKNFPDEWAWDFGDGATDEVQNPVHTYAAEGTYKVCVDATNAAGTNRICKDVWGVKTAIEEAFADDAAIIVYPNPVRENFSIKFKANQPFHGKLELYDVLGRMMLTRTFLSVKEDIDISSVPKGVYLLRLSTNDKNDLLKRVIKD